MDYVRVVSSEPFPGEMVGLIFADDVGGDPAEVVGRVLHRHSELIEMLSGSGGMATWSPAPDFVGPRSMTYPTSWGDD